MESDQQYRGFRGWNAAGGSRTSNNHFNRDMKGPDGSPAGAGCGAESIIAGVVAICRMKFLKESREAVADLYPTAEDARVVVAIVQAARIVRDLDFENLGGGKGAPVSARFGEDGITIVDPLSCNSCFHRIYEQAI